MSGRNLDELYADKEYFMITAHRGASFEFPENTAQAMRKAVEAGADMIEFDLRGTADGVPVLLHDDTIDRTSNGHGQPEDYTLAELKKFNFSYWIQDMRRTAPVYDKLEIPTFEEILQEFRGKAAMNIQVYAKTENVLLEVCRLFKEYDMYKWGYFTLTPDVIDKVRSIDPMIEICPTRGWNTRSNPETLRQNAEKDKARFIQPVREYTDEEKFALMRELGLRSNVFFSDEPEQMAQLKAMGAMGILTNKAHLMCLNR